MKKVSILALHLGYGGIEKAVATLANTLCTSYEVEIACIYQLQEEPAFQIDPKVKVTYLIKEKPNREAWLSALKQVKPITFIKESFYSVKTLYYRKKKMASYIKQSDSDIIIATRYFLDRSLGKYGKATCFKIGWEHNHHHGNQRYEKKIVKSNQKLDALVLVSQDLKKDYQAKLKTCRCVYIPNSIDDYPEIPSDLTQHHLISVGRLSKEKGFFDLIQIFEKIVSSHPDWKYHLFWMISLYSAAPAESHIQLPGFPDLPFLFQEYPADFLSLLSCLHTPAAAACHIHAPAGHIRPAPVCW